MSEGQLFVWRLGVLYSTSGGDNMTFCQDKERLSTEGLGQSTLVLSMFNLRL